MSLTLATLLPGLLILALGAALFSGSSAIVAFFRALPRSELGSKVFFGAGAAWFLYNVLHLSEADFGQYRLLLFVFFGVIAIASFFYVPDFLAVRGLCILMLLGAMPVLDAAYMEYAHPQRLFMVSAVFAGIILALYLGAAPYRLRDFFEWLFRTPGRSRVLGGALAAYGLLLCAVAFTY